MPFAEFLYFEKDGIVDGGTYEDDWSPKEDRVIKRIHLARKDGVSYTASTFYFKIDGTVYTLKEVPCVVLGPDKLTSPVLNIPIKAKATFSFILKNLEGVSIDAMVTLELHKP